MRFSGYIAQWRSAAKEALDRTGITVNFLCWLHFTSNYLCSPVHVFISKIQAFLPFLVLFGYSFWCNCVIPCLQAYGVSMLPTLNVTGDILLADHLSPLLGNVGHGDLVLVRSPLNPKIRLTKRVVAVEGDTVTYFDPLHSEASQVAVVCVLSGLFFICSRINLCFIFFFCFCIKWIIIVFTLSSNYC